MNNSRKKSILTLQSKKTVKKANDEDSDKLSINDKYYIELVVNVSDYSYYKQSYDSFDLDDLEERIAFN